MRAILLPMEGGGELDRLASPHPCLSLRMSNHKATDAPSSMGRIDDEADNPKEGAAVKLLENMGGQTTDNNPILHCHPKPHRRVFRIEGKQIFD